MSTLRLKCFADQYVTNYVLPVDEEIDNGEILVIAAVRGGGEVEVTINHTKEGIFPMDSSEYFVYAWDDVAGMINHREMWELYDDAVNARSTETWIKAELDQVICLLTPMDCDPSFIPEGFVKVGEHSAMQTLREVYFDKEVN